MAMKKAILPLRLFPKPLLIISTITITAGFKLKLNGCLPLSSGKHPHRKFNYSVFIQCPENWVHIIFAEPLFLSGFLSVVVEIHRHACAADEHIAEDAERVRLVAEDNKAEDGGKYDLRVIID